MANENITLPIVKRGNYKDIVLKTKYKRNGVVMELDDEDRPIVIQQGIKKDNYIIVEKIDVEGYEKDGQYGKSYAWKVMYENEEVSFWLNGKSAEKDNKSLIDCGGMGTKVKISLTKEGKYKVDTLHFEKVE